MTGYVYFSVHDLVPKRIKEGRRQHADGKVSVRGPVAHEMWLLTFHDRQAWAIKEIIKG